MRSAVFVILTFLLFSIPIAYAQEIPVNVKAEKLKYIEETGIIEASGSVEVKFKEVTIYADFLRMDSESNLATAEGNVRMVAEDYEATSGSILYDASREVSTFSKFQTRLAPGRVKGHLYLQAEELIDQEEKMLGDSGTLTTCDDDPPHFITKADKVEYYPEDKIIGYNVRLYVGEMLVFWTPYMVYDLSEKKKKNWVFGHNQVEGDYLKSSWDYPYGILYLDLIQKKGIGLGTETDYKLWGLGTLFLYQVADGDAGISNWVTRIEHTKQIDPWTTLKLNHRYTSTYLIPSGRREQTAFNLDLGYKKEANWGLKLNTFDDRLGYTQKYSLGFNQAHQKISTDYSFNYEFSKSDPKWIRNSQRLSHRRPLWSDKVIFSGMANYYNNVAAEGKVGDQRLEPVIEITGQEPNYSWRFYENWYMDLDRDEYTEDDTYQYLEKQPEIEVTPNPLDLKIFTLRPKLGYGHYHEVRYVSQLGGNRDFKSERGQAILNADKRITLGLGTVAILGAGLDQRFYTSGDQLYAYSESLRLQTDLFGRFRNDIDYRKGTTDGNTPFLFDQLGTHYHDLRETMTFYYLNKFRWSVSGGRNWQTKKWFDLDTNVMLRPNERWNWNARTGWDIENRRYKDLVNNLTLVPYGFLSMTFATVSDMNIGELRSGSILYDLYLLKDEPNQCHVKLSQIYDPATRQFKVRDIMIIKDLHCWELKYTYSDYRKEFSFTFSLKALPEEPVGISTGRGFYMEGFEEEIRGLKQEGAVERY
ncbi:hypothetical protein AMJ44_05350 [candidate division WOR-1 bacterium DG_54_3]|uniref:Organic solvent tolerance-like N-terminal domain-containing protein n=1 Tax=candidate division WOR-1 bacterium DG_54_3 TaxID=1703775 RepID=A0A0S7Y216_UNCSA|nr:MAG: hypothetical protein AMJ44_05350 [candidate division WOR-1 bacterium DG_54_3]